MNDKSNLWKLFSMFLLGLIVGFTFNKIIPGTTNSKNLAFCQDLNKCQGNKNAAVTIVEYSDFQCPYCKQYYDETYQQLKKDYIDTQKVYYVFKDYPLPSHPQAPQAAQAASCAAEQNKFWEMHDLLFERQSEWSAKSDHMNIFKNFATSLSLDQTKFNECLDSGKYKMLVDQSRDDGISEGISGTPTFLINGKRIVGGQNYQDVFVKEIEEALKRKN